MPCLESGSKPIRMSIPNLMGVRHPVSQPSDEDSTSYVPKKRPSSGSASKPFRLSIPKLPKLLQRGRRFTAPVTPLSKDDSSRCVRYTRLSRVSPESPIPETSIPEGSIYEIPISEGSVAFVDDKYRSRSLQ